MELIIILTKQLWGDFLIFKGLRAKRKEII